MTNTNTKAADFSVILSSKAYCKAVALGETGKECACCGKQTNEAFWVNTDGEGGINQGCFPVGPECFKKLKKAGITVLTREEMGM